MAKQKEDLPATTATRKDREMKPWPPGEREKRFPRFPPLTMYQLMAEKGKNNAKKLTPNDSD